MRRKLISLINISFGFKIVGFLTLFLGSIAGLWMLVVAIALFLRDRQAEQSAGDSLGQQLFELAVLISPSLSLFLGMLFGTLTAFMLSELILLFLRMEVDIKQIRFTFQGSSPAPVPSNSAIHVAPEIAPLDAAITPVETLTPSPVTPDLPKKSAVDLYAENDKAVPFDVLITPRGETSDDPHETESASDSAPELPVFEPHDEPEEAPKIDTRPISYCPNCNAMIRYKPEKKGKVIKCPKCAQPFRLGVS